MRTRFEIPFDEFDNIVGYIWQNPALKPKGVVQIAHGLSEHILRYEEFALFLVNNGYIVIGGDHYHHGESSKVIENIGIVENYDFIDSVIKSIKLIREELLNEYDVPKILFGHSMGSISAQEYIQKYPNDFNKLILSGTDVGDFKYCLLKLLTNKQAKRKQYSKTTKIVHSLTFGNFSKRFKEQSEFNWLSKNEENVKKYELDPLCGATVSNSTYNSISISLRKSFKNKNINKINKELEIFIFSGSEDPVSNFGKSVNKLYKKYKKASLKATKKLYPGLRHETLNETSKMTVYNDVLEFINK